MKTFILASQSPRRHALLREAGYVFQVLPAHIDESVIPGETPDGYVKRVAQAKAEKVSGTQKGIIVAADTTVALDGRILGKPLDEQDAFDILSSLRGRTHLVITGVCLREERREELWSVTTEVVFRHISDDEIREYLALGESFDKAGAYGIQGAARAFVSEYRGSFSNIVGLPVDEVIEGLSRFGVSRDR